MRLAALALAFAVVAGPALADEMVVVSARGVGLRPGEHIDAAKPLVLAEGQHVTLIAMDGATLDLSGPYNQPPAASGNGTSLSGAMSALLTQQSARTTEVGATRAGGTVADLPDPWVLDVSRTGNVCLLDKEKPVFWRPTAEKHSTLVIYSADRSWKATANWPKGADKLAVSDKWAIHGNAIYFVALDDGDEAAVTVNRVPANLPNAQMRAAWLAHDGCEAQAEALLRPHP